MSTINPAVLPDLDTRRAPGLGGFNLTALRLEIRRLLRNRRTVIITMIFPVFFFLLFGLNKAYALNSVGHGINEAAAIMVSLSLYGAVSAATFGGAMVSIERAQGWSRQLRLTPLSPAAYIAMKVLTALVLGAASVLAVNIAGLRHAQGLDAGLPVGRQRPVRLGRLAPVRRIRLVHGLPATDRRT